MPPFVNARPAALPLFTAAALALLVVMNWVGASLITPAAPTGIISFELAGSPQDSAAMLASWDVAAQRMAAFSLGLDYLFMLAYASAIGLAAVRAGSTLKRYAWPFSTWAHWAGWGVWLAALLDAVENAALAKILLGSAPVSPWPQLAAVCAAIKFALIFLALVYIFYALAASLAARLSS